jgi:hypothetical protein
MALDRQREVDDLCKQARNILLHELTEDEQRFVAELGFANRASLSPDTLSRLKELVRNNGDRYRVLLEAAPDAMVIVDKEKITLHRVTKTSKVILSVRCHKCQLMCRDAEHYIGHECKASQSFIPVH